MTSCFAFHSPERAASGYAIRKHDTIKPGVAQVFSGSIPSGQPAKTAAEIGVSFLFGTKFPEKSFL